MKLKITVDGKAYDVDVEVAEEEPQRKMVNDTVPLPKIVPLSYNDEPAEELAEVETEEGEAMETSPRAMAKQANDASVVIQRPGKPKKYIAKQEELQFDGSHRGRFEKSIETIYQGENLDQPTFRRRKLAIRL